MNKLTRVDALKAQQVKNPGNEIIVIASSFPDGEDGDHKILRHDPVKKTYAFDSKRGEHQVHHTHFYMDRAINEYNLFEL